MNQLFNNYDGFEFNSNDEFVINKKIFDKELNDIFSQINHKYAIEYRDELIASYLKKMEVENLFDIGPDNCTLLLKSKSLGLKVSGIDVANKAIDISDKFNLNVIQLSIHDLVNYKDLGQFYKDYNISIDMSKTNAISCLNIIHGNWEDVKLKRNLLDFIFHNADEVVITCYENDLREIVKNYDIKSYTRLHHYKDIKVSKIYATLLQYGTSFNKKTRVIEKVFSKFKNNIYISKLFSGYRFVEKINPYVALTVIFKIK